MNAITKYFRYRQGLIDQYVKGDMSKNEYLKRNLEAVQSLGIEPFKNIDTVEKGLFNYQYYNALAKNAKMTATKTQSYELRQTCLDESNYYYSRKDFATLAVLRLLDYMNVSAYYIRVNSKYLKGKLFEIVIHEYQMILHSASTLILQKLIDENVFEDCVKESLIDGYINQKY